MEKKQSIAIIHALNLLNLEIGSSGNISFRADSEHIFIKPTSMTYAQVNEENLSAVRIDNSKLVSGANPSSDLASHLEIYRHRKDVACVVHSHSHFATVFAILQMNIPVLSTMHADYFGSLINCLPFINHRESNFGTQIVKSGFDIALLGNHGSLLLLKKPTEAGVRLQALEEVARLYFDAIGISVITNTQLNEIERHHAEQIHKYYIDNYRRG